MIAANAVPADARNVAPAHRRIAGGVGVHELALPSPVIERPVTMSCSDAFTSGPMAVVREMARLSASRPSYPFVWWQTHGVCTVSDMTARFFLR